MRDRHFDAGWVSQWQTFDQVFATTDRRVTALAPTKPFNYNKETDWRLESSPASVAAFKSVFVKGYFVWR